MKKLAAVLIVFVGLFSIALSTPLVSFMMPLLDGEFFDVFALLSLLPFIASLGLGMYLIVKRHEIAGRLFGNDELDLQVDSEGLLRLGLILLGTYLIIAAAGSALDTLVFAVSATFTPGGVGYGTPIGQTIGSILGAAVRIVLGFVLVRRSGALSDWLWAGAELPYAPKLTPGRPTCSACGAQYDPDSYEFGAERLCAACGESLDEPRA